MDWPIQPVEIQQRFVPRFCPRRTCPQHAAPGFTFQAFGSYLRADGRSVPRYRCRTCRRTFSKQTFVVSYYLKRPELVPPVAAGLQAGSAQRQLARSLGCAPSTVTRLSARLGRHALLLQASALAQLCPIDEAIVFDHLEVFARTQDYPFGIATPVGAESWFIYAIDPAPHGRTGRRSPAQEAKRRARPRPDYRGGYRGSVRRMLDVLLEISKAPTVGPAAPLELMSDGHADYRWVLESKAYEGRVSHKVYPNPKRGPKGSKRSPAARRRDAALFPIDQLHSLLRHTVAHHRRETIAFGRRLNAIMERMFLTVVWKNFVKGVSERKPDHTTPAMRRGLAESPWNWSRVFARRLFPDRLAVPQTWLELYRREWLTPGGLNSRHELKLAF